MRLTKTLAVATVLVAGTLAFAWTVLVPCAIERETRARLHDAGFSHAAFAVGRIALDRVELLDVALADGLYLGDLEIEAGPYALWRGAHADVILHGPRLDAGMLIGGGRGDRRLPFRKVVVDAGELVAPGARIAVRGTIDLRGTLDLVASAPVVVFGSATLADVAVTARGPLTDLRVCATGQAAHARIDACATLDALAPDLVASLGWTARDDGGAWAARGTGRLVRARDSVALEAGVIDAVVAYQRAGLAVAGGSAHVELEGDLATRTYAARGEVAATTFTAGAVTLHHARLPFAVTGVGAAVHSVDELVGFATSAVVKALGKELRVEAPVFAARGATGAGGFTFAAGDARDAFQLVARLRGVPLDHVLRSTTRDRIRGSGVLDGELVFALDDGRVSLVGGGLAARAPGRLVTAGLAPETMQDPALHRRIAAALADFAYSRLSARVGTDAVVHLSLEGTGHRVPQPLAIDINVRGLLAHHEENR